VALSGLLLLGRDHNATNELFTEVADKNPIFKKLYESMSAFRNEPYAGTKFAK